MAKSINSTVLDQALNYLKNNGTKMVLCSAQPTTYTEGNATYMLANVTMASGDYTLANGDTSGRKVTMAAKTGISVSNAGTGTHVAILDTTGTALLLVTTCTSQAVSSGGTCDIGSWKDEIQAPT